MFGLAVLLFDFLLDKRDKYLNAVLALIGLGFALLQLGMFWFGISASARPAYLGFDGTFAFDSFAIVAKIDHRAGHRPRRSPFGEIPGD